jgi:hypothetical protein
MNQKITRNELKKLTSEFNTTADRFKQTVFSDASANLKRLLDFIRSTPILIKYIESLPQQQVDYEAAILNKGPYDPIKMPLDTKEEASFVYNFFLWIETNYHEKLPYYVVYGYGENSKKPQDHMNGFNNRVTVPFVNFLNQHLTDLMNETDVEKNDSVVFNFSAPVQQLNYARDTSNLTVNNSNQSQINEIQKLVSTLTKNLDSEEDLLPNQKQELIECSELLVEQAEKKPKKTIIKLIFEKLETIIKFIKTGTTTYEIVSKLIIFAKSYL